MRAVRAGGDLKERCHSLYLQQDHCAIYKAKRQNTRWRQLASVKIFNFSSFQFYLFIYLFFFFFFFFNPRGTINAHQMGSVSGRVLNPMVLAVYMYSRLITCFYASAFGWLKYFPAPTFELLAYFVFFLFFSRVDRW